VINLIDLRKGANERHPATLPENFVEQAWNITYDRSQLGARRNGSSFAVSPTSSFTLGYSMHVHTPDSTAANERLWVYGSNDTFHFYTSAWAQTSPSPSPADTFSFGGSVSWASLHGKLFIAANSDVSRLHVYDGTTLRRAGMATPAAAPTAADGGGAGTLSATARYYRARYTVQSGGITLLRSEPSAVLTFTPSGANANVTVTKPATVSESETHWELELSIDNANFYRIATTAVGTTTYADTLAPSVVASTGTLSADSGDYTVPESARFLVVDRDRLLMFGNYEDATKDSDMTWTVVGTDTSGVGNDERVPTDTGNRLAIDGRNGGRLTGAAAYDTQVIAFKKKAVYLISHTRNRVGAYTFDPLSTTFGAVEGSVCAGVDEVGRAALYFLDEALGPMRYGARGFEQLAPQQQSTFQSYFMTTASTIPSHTVYLPKRREVHFHIAQVGAVNGTSIPTLALVYNIETGGVSWQFRAGDTNRLNGFPIYASARWNSTVYITSSNGSGGGAIIQIDVDGTTTDFATLPIRAWIRTKAFALEPLGLQRRFRVTGAVLGARPLTGATVTVKAIRDHGKEIASTTASLTPNAATNPSAADERFVTVPMDDLVLSEATVMQFELGDADAVSASAWSLEQFSATIEAEGGNVGRR
jgi:hypothetical protein